MFFGIFLGGPNNFSGGVWTSREIVVFFFQNSTMMANMFFSSHPTSKFQKMFMNMMIIGQILWIQPPFFSRLVGTRFFSSQGSLSLRHFPLAGWFLQPVKVSGLPFPLENFQSNWRALRTRGDLNRHSPEDPWDWIIYLHDFGEKLPHSNGNV